MKQLNDTLIQDLIEICRRLEQKELVSATDGNVSVRTDRETFYTTRSGVNKGEVTPDDIIEVNDGGFTLNGTGKPSSELKMHLFIYKHRPDVQAVVHAHPPHATAFAVAGIPLNKPVFPEVLVKLGSIPVAPYATPSTDEVGKSIEPYVAAHNAILLGNHGAVTFGSSLKEAYYNMEKVEHAARITLYARLLGGERELTRGQVEELTAMYRREK
jgi:L-fuculose-phosphate aldolase